MSTLRELQSAFREAMLAEDAGPAATLVRDDGLAAEARLQIYRHHVLTTLAAVLEGVYPAVRRLVDPRFFAYAADTYVRREPPRGPCLSEYGDGFAEFLAGFPPCRDLPWLPDVARLEWAMHRAPWADEEPPLDPTALREVPADDVGRLVLRLDPSLSLVRSPWPVDHVWRANQPDADPGATVDLDAGPATIEVRRLGDDVVFRRLEPGVYAFRRALADGLPLEAAAEAALDVDPALDLAAALGALLEERLLTGFALERSPMAPAPLATIRKETG